MVFMVFWQLLRKSWYTTFDKNLKAFTLSTHPPDFPTPASSLRELQSGGKGAAATADPATVETPRRNLFTSSSHAAFYLKDYLNGTLLDPHTIIQNVTFRFISKKEDVHIVRLSQAFYETAATGWRSLDNSTDLKFVKRSGGVAAPLLGPDAVYAVSPSNSASSASSLEGSISGEQNKSSIAVQQSVDEISASGKNISTGLTEELSCVDVEMLTIGNATSQIIRASSIAELNGYWSITMGSFLKEAQSIALNLSETFLVAPAVKRMPFPIRYVLGTVIEMRGAGFFPVNIHVQNMMHLVLISAMGSHPHFLFNRIQSVWQDSSNGLARVGIFTYVTKPMASTYEAGGGAIAGLLVARVESAGGNLEATIINSSALGTQHEELNGSPKFHKQLAALEDVSSTGGAAIAPQSISHHKHQVFVILMAVFGTTVCLGGVILMVSMLKGLGPWSTKRRCPGSMPYTSPWSSSGVPMAVNVLAHHSEADGATDTDISESLKRYVSKYQLHGVWNIEPSELAFCQNADGSDWILGSGSFGQVYRGLRGGVQDVAIKVMQANVLQIRLFEKELSFLRYLNFDRNLAQFYGACMADGVLMLVLEYMEGGDLTKALGADSEYKLGWYGRGGHIFMDVARGLHFLHSNNVAHRDLKGSNILLTRSGEAKIGDVGLAKLVGNYWMSTQLETTGSFAYAAPELLIGGNCDQRVDIFSFGVVMWEVLTHELPARGAMRKIIVPEEAPEEVTKLMDRCLEQLPESRPTAKELFQSLCALVTDASNDES